MSATSRTRSASVLASPDRATLPIEMSLTKDKKNELIGKYGRADGDTGSAEVQVALLTERINELTEHLRSTARTITRAAVC